MSKTEQKFVDMVVMKLRDNPLTLELQAQAKRAMALLDDQIKGQNPKLYDAMMDSRAKGF